MTFGVKNKTAVSTEIFVSPEGNDSNEGTRRKPFRSIHFAVEKLKAGITLTLLEGTYHLESIIILKTVGNEKAWIIFSGENGAQ